ncbi:MAG: flagella protein, partial [Methanosarcinales archaeon]|nr:flagella protein [Methanosarcinales archaeon]
SISDAQEESKGVENMVSIDTQIHAPLVKLTQIKNEQPFVKLCMEWLEFLLELVGKNNMPEILDYYVGVGWISDDARLELMLMARGMDNYTEKDEWKLHPDDHLKSLWFIEQLCGIKVDRFTMQQIDRDISKMKDGLETLYNI